MKRFWAGKGKQVDSTTTRDYILFVMGVDLSILKIIAKNLAISLSDLCKESGVKMDEMKDKLMPLLAANYVKEVSALGDPVYSITAEGSQELEELSSRKVKAFAAGF